MQVMVYVSLCILLLALGVIVLVYLRRRHPAKAKSEKRAGQVRRRQFIDVAQEKRLGQPRRHGDCPPNEMGSVVINELDPLAHLTHAMQRNVSEIEAGEKGVEVEKKKPKLEEAD